MKSKLAVLLGIVIFAAGVTGCSKKADLNKTVDQIKTEVQAMSLNDLQANAKAYANEIASKKTEVEKVTQQVKSLSPADIFGEKGKSLKDQLSKIGSEVSALTERYQVYAQKYQEKGGDLANIKLS